MDPRLQYLFDVLETDRCALFEKVRPLSFEQFHRSIAGKWSLSQILDHLLTAEKLSRQYMSKKILGAGQVGDTGLYDEVKMAILKLSQRLPFKFKAPRSVVDNTISHASADKLEQAWNLERAELKNFLESIPENYTQKKIFKHVRAGRLNVQHALIFFREHYVHHLPQIRRLL